MAIDKKDSRFDKGDAVIHPTLGAGIVIGLPNFIMQKENMQFYKIDIIGKTKTMIMIPVKNAGKLGLRHATPSLELESVWHVLSDSAQNLPDDNRVRTQILEDKVKLPGIIALAEVIRDLEWRNSQKGHLNTAEKRIYDHAMDMVAGEIAVSLDVQMQSARSKIKEQLDVSLAHMM